MHYWVWLALAGGFLVVEILTMSLIFLSFALAALVGALAAALWSDSYLQWVGFAVAAVLSLAVIRPLVRKYLFRKSSGTSTGFAALIHEEATTITEVTTETGRIRLRNEVWTARCDSGSIPEGASVTVVRIDGAVAIVTPKHSRLSA
ncbi:MAG: NfeD family protein [Actinobacteria bacterium]|nr:NfeD family protein [Actinomycetota bacterium]